jgi:HEAT repeat protein
MMLTALSDAEPKVRETALKILFDRGSTAPALFAFCGRILREPDESNEKLARLICSRLTSYDRGERRETCVALLLDALGDAGKESGGLWSSLKRSVTTESGFASIKVAACQALGRLRATEAREALEHVSQHPNPALKRAAQRALQCLRNENRA